MKDSASTIVTHADVYVDEVPSTSEGFEGETDMFGRSGRGIFRKQKKESSSKRHHIRKWIEKNEGKSTRPPLDSLGFGGVMMSGDSPPPVNSSIPSSGYDTPEEMRPGKITPVSTQPMLMTVTKPSTNGNANTTDEDIEESMNATINTLSTLDPLCKTESNGFDHTDSGKLMNNEDENNCIVQCVYYTQQCCECTIL